jgi:thiol-disulfide isomerase/thioredoxin
VGDLCLPCREEMRLLQDAFERYGDQVRFLGVDTQDRPGAAASFVTDLQIAYPHVLHPDGALLSERRVTRDSTRWRPRGDTLPAHTASVVR